MTDNLPPPAILRKLLRYEPDTGKLFWLRRPVSAFPNLRSANSWNSRYAGKEAFTADDGKGYRNGHLLGTVRAAHRVIWAIVHCKWPDGEIDHINGVRHDNRIENLRDVPKSVNQRNAKMRSHNTSGHNGVAWDKKDKKWRAYIRLDGLHTNLGGHNCITAALIARKLAEIGHGFTDRHGV